MKQKLLFLSLFFVALFFTAESSNAQNVSATWASSSGSAWYTGSNWTGGAYAGSQGAAATNSNVATFTSVAATNIGINMNTNSLNLGAISVDNTRTTALNIGNSSSAAAGSLRLYGATVNSIANTIVRNNGTGALTLPATLSGGGTMGVVLSNTTENIVATDNTGNVVISAILSGSGKLTKAGTGSGILTISGVNTYSGGTTVTSGTLALGVANALPTSGIVTLNGGTLSSGGFNQSTAGTRTLALTDNSTLALGSGSHTLAFAASNAVSWTSGKTLTITGWTGTIGGGTSGTAGKVIVGSSASGLTAAQLAQIKFSISSVEYAATMLSSGEIVPVLRYAITSISPVSPTAGTGFDVTVQAQNYSGVATNVSSASTFALSTNGNGGTIGGTTTGTIASGTPSVTVSGVTLSTAGTGVTLTATTTSGALLSPGTSSAFTVGNASTPILSISGTTSHGSLCVGTAGSSIQYTISNTGSVQADGISVSSNNTEFIVSGLSSTSIPASGSATFNVVFTPSASGSRSATITVTSTTSGTTSPTASLTGTGIASVTPVVTTTAASGVNNTIATLNGNLGTIGVCPNTLSKGFVYAQTSVNNNPVNGGTGVTTTSVGSVATGNFSLALTSLPPSTSYSYKAYVFDGTTYTYGALQTFTTLSPANHLTLSSVPSSGNVGVALTTFTVEARRADNTIDDNYTASVAISKASGPGNLSGTLTVSAVAGVATFSTATFDAAGTYTLSAASGSLTGATSGNIVVTLAPVSIFANTITGTNPSSSNPYTSGQTVDSHLTATGIGRGAGLSASSANDRYSATAWSTGALDTTDYFEFTITPSAGYELDLSSFVYTGQASGTGPTSFAFRSSLDSFGSNIGSPNVGGTTISLSATAYQHIQSAITFRFYAYTAGASTGTFSINDFIFNGNVLCKEPSAFTVTGGGSTCNPSGLAVGLSGSETGVNYQLKRDGNNVGSAVAGTGSALAFGNQTVAGTYTVVATNVTGGCNVSATMTGNAVIAITTATTWTGAQDSNWNNANNWSCAAVPTSASDVTIPTGTPGVVISSDAFANTLALGSGTLLTVLSGNDLTVTGAITSTAGNMIVENNANVIQVNNTTNTGIAKVKRDSSALMRQDYTLWSSPVSGQDLLDFSPNTLLNRFYTYNTDTNLYNTVTDPNATSFAAGTGYLIRMPNNHPTTPTVWNGEFNGTLHNGDISVALANIGPGQRFNAIGNPYPSPISMSSFVSDNSGNITGTLYFWRKTNAASGPSYCTWSQALGFVTNGQAQVFDPQGIIRTGQGFLVEALASGTQAVFHNSQRSGDNANQFFRNANEVVRHRIWLNATGEGGAFSQTLVGYVTDATLDDDAGIDGHFFNDGDIAFYSLIGQDKFVIQGRPVPFADTDVVPMGFKATNAGSYTISIDTVDGIFAEGQAIYLRDNMTGAVHDLNSGGYTFASEAGTFDGRFDVLYQNQLSTDNPSIDGNAIVIYKRNGQFVINSGSQIMTSVQVHDVLGKLVKEVRDINAQETNFTVNSANQLLLFTVNTGDGAKTVKKMVN